MSASLVCPLAQMTSTKLGMVYCVMTNDTVEKRICTQWIRQKLSNCSFITLKKAPKKKS